jgi:hypothetical protein
MTGRVSDSNKVLISIELTNRLDDSDSSDVVTLSAIGNVSYFHLVDGINRSGLKIELNSVLDLDILSEELEGSSVVSSEVTDLVWSDELLLDSAEFEVFLLSLKRDKLESSLDVIKDSV